MDGDPLSGSREKGTRGLDLDDGNVLSLWEIHRHSVPLVIRIFTRIRTIGSHSKDHFHRLKRFKVQTFVKLWPS